MLHVRRRRLAVEIDPWGDRATRRDGWRRKIIYFQYSIPAFDETNCIIEPRKKAAAATIAEGNPELVGEQGDQGMWPC
jgi:hypothetical protein